MVKKTAWLVLCAALAGSLGSRAFAQGDLAEGLKKGYRGVTLPAKKHQLLNLKAGDRVDVLVTFDALMKDNRKEKVTATILQNVVVLSVDRTNDAVELELNPNESQYAALGENEGELWFIARAPGDTEMKPMEMASFRKLFR